MLQHMRFETLSFLLAMLLLSNGERQTQLGLEVLVMLEHRREEVLNEVARSLA